MIEALACLSPERRRAAAGQSVAGSCEDVTYDDLFDFVLPFGLDPGMDPSASRSGLASHVWTCPTCLSKVQRLHEVLYGIAERPASGVVTRFQVDDDDLGEAGPSVARIGPRTGLGMSAWAKGLAAAVVVVAGIGWLSMTGTVVGALDLQGIYRSFDRVHSVHMSMFDASGSLIQEKWVSRTTRRLALKQAGQVVLWDLSRSTRTQISPSGGIQTQEIPAGLVAHLEQQMGAPVELMPFQRVSDVPPDSQWRDVTDLRGTPSGIRVYELEWQERSVGEARPTRRWRVSVDAQTFLPVQAERFIRFSDEEPFVLESRLEVRYPTDAEVLAVLDAMAR